MRALSISLSIISMLASHSVIAACPDINPAPRTINDTAENYSKSPGFSLNEEGILQFDYGAHHGGLGKWANPFFDSNYALALYRDWLKSECKDDALKENFLHQAKWLASTAKVDGDIASWPLPFRDKNFDLDPGWISGIGQSRIAGVLLRAEAITDDPELHEIARKALHAYDVDIKDGGVVTVDDQVTWIEEMADPKGRSYKVLNGHITGLSGILDFYEITHEQKWKDLFDRGVAAVKRDIPKFDAGFSSYYSLLMPSQKRPIAPLGDYNPLHVSQLLWLYEKSNDPVFLDYAMRFQAYETNEDSFSASSSIDPVRHGPDSVRAKYGSSYWSVGKFPAWFDITAPQPELIRGLSFDVSEVEQAPAKFTVLAEVDGKMVQVAASPDVLSKNTDIIFDKPVLTGRVRIDMPVPGPKKMVALRMAMLLRQNTLRAPVANECNHTYDSRKKVNPNNIDSAFDGDDETAMTVICDGWIVSEVGKDSLVSVRSSASEDKAIKFYGSDDLAAWTEIENEDARSAHIPFKFVKFDIDTSMKGIVEVTETKVEDMGILKRIKLFFMRLFS